MSGCSYLFWAAISQCLWNEVTLNEEDISYMFDETTPVKACGDLSYHVNHSGMTLLVYSPNAYSCFVVSASCLLFLIWNSGFQKT